MATLGLPDWPTVPEPVDPTGRCWLIIACGAGQPSAVAAGWAAAARPLGPVRLVAVERLDLTGVDVLHEALTETRTGVRIMVSGNEYDVLSTLALARSYGACSCELRSFVVDDGVIPIFCAHCRDTHRVRSAPGATVECPVCERRLAVHQHHSALRGSYLASDARARELV